MTTRVSVCVKDQATAGQVSELLRAMACHVTMVDAGTLTGEHDDAVAWVIDEAADAIHGEVLLRVVGQKPSVFLQSSGEARRTAQAFRAGYRECLLLPEDLALLPAVIRRLQFDADGVSRSSTGPQAPIFCVYSATGGSGRTSLTAHFAAALASHGVRTLAVDLNLRFGALRHMLGVAGGASVADLLGVLHELNDHHLENAIDHLGPNLDLLAAPGAGFSTELLDTAVRPLLQAYQRRYAALVIDLPAGLGNTTITALSMSSETVYVLEPTAVGLWALGAVLSRVDPHDFAHERLRVIINHRSPHLVALDGVDIKQLYGLISSGELRFDPTAPTTPIVRAWADRTHLSGLARDVDRIVAKVLGTHTLKNQRPATNPAPSGLAARLFGLIHRPQGRIERE